MADPKTAKDLSVEEIFARLDETEALKKQAIDQLLAQREQIDAQLARLGHKDAGGSGKGGKKRLRRTKAQIEAEKAKSVR